MGTDPTVAFQDSLPKSGHSNFRSWKRPVVSAYLVPIADGGGNRERPFAKSVEIGEAATNHRAEVFARAAAGIVLAGRGADVTAGAEA